MASRQRTAYLIKMCELVIRAGIEKYLKNLEVTGLQYMVLSIVSRGQKCSVADLARRCRVTPQSMNELVVTLEQKGLIERSVDPANRRILRIALTSKGNDVLNGCDRQMNKLESRLFACLSGHELGVLRESMRRVVAHADAEMNLTRPKTSLENKAVMKS